MPGVGVGVVEVGERVALGVDEGLVVGLGEGDLGAKILLIDETIVLLVGEGVGEGVGVGVGEGVEL